MTEKTKPAGSVEPFKRTDGSTYYRASIRLADDSRVRVDIPEKYKNPAGCKTARERAELYTAAQQEREDDTGSYSPPKRAKVEVVALANGETSDKYFERSATHRSDLGKVRRKHGLESAWNTSISRKFGKKPIAAITRQNIENVRDALDVAVTKRKKGERPRASVPLVRGTFGVLTGMMKEACASKKRDLRGRRKKLVP